MSSTHDSAAAARADSDVLSLPRAFDAAERARIRARIAALPVERVADTAASRAAVLVPLCHVHGVPSVLFTKRTERVSTHKGQVSFPGGRHDPTDVDDVDTALRELAEETGIARHDVEVIAPFHEAMAITGTRVTSVVAYVGELADLRGLALSADEIDEAFTLTLAQLVDPQQRERRRLGTREAPFFLAGPHPVWGLTAFILERVLVEALGLPLPPARDGGEISRALLVGSRG